MNADQAITLSTFLEGQDDAIHATSSGIASKKNNPKNTPHEKLQEATFSWFEDMRATNVPLSGEVVQQKTPCFARMLGYDDFRANPCWLIIFTANF